MRWQHIRIIDIVDHDIHLSSYFSFSRKERSMTVKGTNLLLSTMYLRCFS